MDFIFYERLWNDEVVSGNYVARHTHFTRTFLLHWARYFYRQPTGFSSADNGALHAALSQVKRSGGTVTSPCEAGYASLTHDVYDLAPYFAWIKTCRLELEGRRFIQGIIDQIIGNVIIVKRGTGFVADGAYLDWKTNQADGYPRFTTALRIKRTCSSKTTGAGLVVN